jgi:hypothetical protein
LLHLKKKFQKLTKGTSSNFGHNTNSSRLRIVTITDEYFKEYFQGIQILAPKIRIMKHATNTSKVVESS